MTGTYRIAGRVIGIRSLYAEVHEYCKDYRCEEVPEITVETTVADIAYEREQSIRTARLEGRQPSNSSDSYLEELAVYRKIAEKMPLFDTFLFHGSCIAVDGEGYLFTARSGTGKSTHTRLWREMLGDRAIMVNDDKPLMTASECGIMIHGTPYNGKHRLGSNISVPLKAICLLERAADNTIERVSPHEVYPRLLQQTYRPRDPAALVKTMELLDTVIENVKLYRLGCNMESEAARVAYEGMR